MKRSITGAFVALAIAAIVIFAIPLFLAHVRAQTAPANLPTSGNPVVAKIIDPGGNLTALQPLIVIQNSQLHVSVPEPTSSFRPGKYRLDLWIWQNGTIYYTENDFTWGVLVDDFDKSIYTIGDTVHAGFAVLDDTGNTICGADMSMDITSPTGKLSHFSTADGTITRNTTCGKNNVTESPDYSATLKANEAGTYSVAVTAATAAGKRTILDQFEAQNLPLFDVARSLPVRIYPPATYKASLTLKANTDFSGNIIETVPASFAVSNAGSAQITFSHNDTQSISWPANLRKGDSVTLGYSFKAPDVSPELYKLGPLQIGSWQEARQWQIAGDVVCGFGSDIGNGTCRGFIATTASTTWTVPSDWNSASNTIEVIGGGAGGITGKSAGSPSNRYGGGGGGGAAYVKISNLSLTANGSVTIQVGGGGGADTAGTDSWFNGSTCAGASACAKAGAVGTKATGGAGGATSTSVGSVKFVGGNGGNGSTGSSGTDGGGGGAAGLNGAGGNGSGATGGTGDNGTTAAGANGQEWSTSPQYGSGGGGAGGAGLGGTYGAGGGGGALSSSQAGGTGAQGIIVITYTPTAITLGNGVEPAGVTIGPGANATTSDVFTFVTSAGTSTITNVTTTLSTVSGVSQVQITNNAGTTVYGSSTNPGSATVGISLSGMNVSSSATTFRILVKPLSATSMPAVPGGTYVVTSTISGWVDSKTLNQAGSNTTSSPVTIDNQSPADVTNASGTASSGQVALSWTNPGDADFAQTVVLRAASSISAVPVEGASYSVGNTINATTTVVCVVASSSNSCIDTGLTNGVTYYYEIFTADNYHNYSGGVVPTGNPFTPSAANSPPTVSNPVLNKASPIILTPLATTTITVVASTTDPDGAGDIRYATSTIYRSGVGPNCTQNNLDCYQIASSSCTFADSTSSVICSANIWYFAQATDVSSSFSAQNWQGSITVHDSVNNTANATSTGVELDTSLAINVTTSSINYGTINPGFNTGSTNQTTVVQNAGNSSTTLEINGTALTLGVNSIATSSQHYATSSFTFGGSEQLLNGSATTVPGFLLTTATSTAGVQGSIFWGISVPSGKPAGTYSGSITFTAVFSS